MSEQTLKGSENRNITGFFRKKIRITFGIKLTLIVTLILLGSIWAVASLMAMMVSLEFARNAEESNFDINGRAAAGIRERLYKVRSEALLLLDMTTAIRTGASQIQAIFFERNPGVAAVMVYGEQELLNRVFLTQNSITREDLANWLVSQTNTINMAREGAPIIKNASPATGVCLLALFYPWQYEGAKNTAIVFFSPENLSEISGTGASTTIVINNEGDILIHPEFNRVLAGENISSSPLAEALKKSTDEHITINYIMEGNRHVGAGHRIPFADLAVFSSMEYSVITGQIAAVTRRNIYISAIVMFLTILVTWFFSKTITNPVKRLTAAAIKIGTGEFINDLKHNSNDEIGDLTREFREMGKGLDNYVKNISLAGRYNKGGQSGKDLKGKLNVSGEYKEAVVLFMDLVSFRNIADEECSEKAGKEKAVLSLGHLNSMISLAEESIEKTGGIIDRIMGNRLIAVWGIPAISESLSGEVMNCIRSVITIRTALWEFNIEQESAKKPLYAVYCGIHEGKVLAGSVGSQRLSQYMVAGKTVDYAEKIAEACQLAEIDVMISGTVKKLAGNNIITEKPETQAGNEADLWGLVNLTADSRDKQRWPHNLADIRESLRNRRIVQQEMSKNNPDSSMG